VADEYRERVREVIDNRKVAGKSRAITEVFGPWSSPDANRESGTSKSPKTRGEEIVWDEV